MFPELFTDNEDFDKAYRIAVSDIQSNIKNFQCEFFKEKVPVFIAGDGYVEPWTRDASINIWNGLGLFEPQIAKNTLLSVLKNDNGTIRIGGEYWDAIIWVTGAYAYYLYTLDNEFKALLTEVAINSLKYFERTEFDENKNLFRGGSCYGDGISAYPDIYAKAGNCGIVHFPVDNPQYKVPIGEGNPIMTLSTNCLYYNAYKIVAELTNERSYKIKAEKLKTAINKFFWNEQRGNYNYIVDDFGGSEQTEGLGISFAILFDVADRNKIEKIINNTYISKQGIPCLYPEYDRYKPYGIGRHCGTVWSHINAFWADAEFLYNKQGFEYEFNALTKRVLHDGFFAELNHPESGDIYGGVQEWKGIIVEWKAEVKQLWCASGYLRMIFKNILGFEFSEKGLHIRPHKTNICNKISVKGLKYRNITIDMVIENMKGDYFIPATKTGEIKIKI